MKKTIISLSIIFGISLLISRYFLKFIISLIPETIDIITLAPYELLTMLFTISLYFCFILGSIFYFIKFYFQYKEALYENELKFVKLMSFSLFIGILGSLSSIFFSIFYIIPYLYAQNLGIVDTVFSLTNFLSFIFTNMILFFFILQIPFIVRGLIRYGLVSKSYFKNYRKHYFIAILIFGALFTPPDILSLGMFAVPSYGLYEVGLL